MQSAAKGLPASLELQRSCIVSPRRCHQRRLAKARLSYDVWCHWAIRKIYENVGTPKSCHHVISILYADILYNEVIILNTCLTSSTYLYPVGNSKFLPPSAWSKNKCCWGRGMSPSSATSISSMAGRLVANPTADLAAIPREVAGKNLGTDGNKESSDEI